MTAPGRRVLAILAGLIALLCAPLGMAAAQPLALGFSDITFTGPQGAIWLHRSAAAGAGMVRIDIGWNAPSTAKRPTGFDARNPADPHYDFSAADAAIERAASDGLKVLVTFTGAPAWADGPGRPAGVSPGTWRPSPSALRDYGIALARRYSGRFSDPAHPGRRLPRVAAFQVWNEPNLSTYLNPQWSGGRPASPAIYRAMLDAFYGGVKSVDPRALVVTAGTGPFGDPWPGGGRVMPVVFWRDLLCLDRRAIGCPGRVHFDVFAHHPYSVGSPSTSALQPDDVSIPDLGKLTSLVRAAERKGTALPRVRHPLWITEVSYDSAPPDPDGVPVAEQARWLEQSLELLWRGGASAVFWNQVGDEPPIPSYAATAQSGVYYLNGGAKPSLAAFRFPLVAWRSSRSAVEVWGRAPRGGRLVIQRRTGGAWRTLRVVSIRSGSVFTARLAMSARAVSLRARVGSATSLPWSVR